MERVIVKVRGEQTGADGETSAVEVVAEGRHYYRDGMHYVLYDDSVEEERVETMLRIDPYSLHLTRNGAIIHEQHFARGTESVSEYETPLGNLTLSVVTRDMKIAYGTVSGEIKVDYAMSVNGVWQSDNKLLIEVAPEADEVKRLN